MSDIKQTLRELQCLVLGHEYRIWQVFRRDARHIYCERCQQDWGMHDGLRTIVPWTGDFEQMYTEHGFNVRPRRKP